MSATSFVGRRQLLGRLDDRLQVSRSSGLMLAIRGRRQVGKSRLITHFVESSGLPYLYFTALKRGSVTQQMELLVDAVRASKRPLADAGNLFAAPPASWRDALGRVAVACRETPSIVVLDELPWALESDPTLEANLKISWDTDLQHAPILFVIVGSDVAMMERLQQHDRPLYGIPRPFVVGPFSPLEVGEATGSTDPIEVFDSYLTTGGYPGLVAERSRFKDFDAFVSSQLSDPNSGLVTVAQLTLDAELADAEQARRILSAIGWDQVGFATFSNVVGRIPEQGGAAQQATSRALRHLVDAKGLVVMDLPIGARSTSKLRRYRVSDPYLRFWLRFVERHVADIARGRPDIALDDFKRGFSSWRGRAIESVIHEAIFRLGPTEEALGGVDVVGGWWTRTSSHEYDIVASDRDGRVIVVGSVKWRRKTRFTLGERSDLVEARAVVPGASDAKLVVVCPAGLVDGVEVDLSLTPERLLEAWAGPGTEAVA